MTALRHKRVFVIVRLGRGFKVPLPGCRSERRHFDRGMHKAVSVGQSSRSDMFADGRPREILSMPVDRCYSHIGKFEKFPRQRKETLEDRLLCGKHECAEFAKAAAMGRFEQSRLIDHTDVGDVVRRRRIDDLFRIDAERGDVRRPCHRGSRKISGMRD